jgi:hypothetical protein
VVALIFKFLNKKMSDGLETCRKITAIIGALFALGISIPFTVVYAN